MADMIVCGSEFVRQSVITAGGPGSRCVVIPYGIDQPTANGPRLLDRTRRLRVLTVGAVGLRKGSPYVLAAARVLGGLCEFRVAGPLQASAKAIAELRDTVDLLGAVPRVQIAKHYAWADVFLLPSICEGSATVVYEALGHGLPVVTTPNAGSVVTHGQNGFIVPIRDVGAIVQALRYLMADEQRYSAMSASALAAAKTYSFERYAAKLVETLNSLA